jgi:hypothetical protein
LSLAGSHNAVPPIRKGIGNITAIKILKDKKKLAEEYKNYKKDILIRSKLAMIPFDPIEISKLENKKETSITNFKNYCNRKYGIKIEENSVKFARRFTYE